MQDPNLRPRLLHFFIVPAATLALLGACTVNLDDFTYDQERFEEEKAKQGGTGGSSTTGDETGGQSNSDFCQSFCEDSAEHCPFGSDSGYADADECTESCEGFSTEALECRLVELKQAESDPETHCPNTLADGGDSCPSAELEACDGFCKDAGETCVFGSEIGYADEATCLSSCGLFNEAQLECRLIHVDFAKSNAQTHCPHILVDGGGTCPDATPNPCNSFCSQADPICPFGSELGYADLDECLNECEKMDEEALSCRVVHLGFAESDATGHCPHTLADGGGTCPDITQ